LAVQSEADAVRRWGQSPALPWEHIVATGIGMAITTGVTVAVGCEAVVDRTRYPRGIAGKQGVFRVGRIALQSKPFAFRTVWASGEERNVTSARAASA